MNLYMTNIQYLIVNIIVLVRADMTSIKEGRNYIISVNIYAVLA